ncbi:MAG TPA: fused MFS/spermidine synthase [Polyangiaceae bacterium]|nr:fused MFS/spermidine synthase [Polyangiaceae bacterium]
MSGGAGLVDQVCFSKYLSYVVGATAYAVSAVLAAFMTGLAAGAALGGRLSHRVRRPLLAYGVAELVVAGAVACTPFAFGALTPLYVDAARHAHGSLFALSALRWGCALLIVVAPTTAMGTTLPLVSAALARRNEESLRERRLAALYATNTLGGALGSLAGAYMVLPALGLSHTLWAAAAASAGAGTAAIALGRDLRAMPLDDVPSPANAVPRADEPAGAGWLSVIAFASGFLAFAMEVTSTHLLAVIVGSSAYAFGLILAAFLTWLFLGAAIAPRLSRAAGRSALATSLALTALAMTLTLTLWQFLPLAFGGLGQYVTTFAGREAMRALVAFGVLALPVTAMGLTFPLVLSWAAAHENVGRLVGRFTAVNTIGAVAGALSTGYVVLPWLGSERTLLAVAVVFAALALATAARDMASTAPPRSAIAGALALATAARDTASSAPSRSAIAGALAAILVGVLVPRWNVMRLTAGTNVYFDSVRPSEELLSVREDVHGGITTVTIHDGVHTLFTNGKFQGNDGWELNAQRYFAHYPSLFVSDFGKALIIGFGTGTTLGTLATYPWRELDVVEISPSIVDAAGRFFAGPNRAVLLDPRVHVTLDDARNYLLVHEDQYDLVSMELSSVWFAGASSLYSGEYYRLVRAHLAPSGVFQQWVQLHHVYRPVLAALIGTLRREFPHVALFYGGGQGILVSSKRPLRWSVDRARTLSVDANVGATLPYGRPLETLAYDILAMDEGLDRFIADSAEEAGVPEAELVSTDDNLFLEYQTPRGNVLPWEAREALVSVLRRYRDPDAIAALAVHSAAGLEPSAALEPK